MKDLIIDIFKYFAKFVPKNVLEKNFVQPAVSKYAGYDMIRSEVMALPPTNILPELDTFIVSINENFVSERMKNVSNYILFVEYGPMTVDHTIPEGILELLAVSIVRKFSDTNNDSINELIQMDKCFELLDTILQTMTTDQSELGFCDALVTMPIKVEPVAPELFYGCGGWVAKFKKTNTKII